MFMLQVNERRVAYQKGMRIADLSIVNGYPVSGDTPLNYGDICCLIKRGESPSVEEMRYFIVAHQQANQILRIILAAVDTAEQVRDINDENYL
jgi:hypothetical protein